MDGELWYDDHIIPEGWEDDAANVLTEMEGPEACEEALLAGRQNGLLSLARFAPVLRTPGFHFATWIELPPDETGSLVEPVCVFSSGASDFVATAFHSNWVRPIDWRVWRKTDEAAWLEANPAHVKSATEEQLAKLLTTLIRSERFCEGALLSAFHAGFLTAIAERAEALLHVLNYTSENQEMENALPASQPAPNWVFRRGLDKDFVDALEVLAKQKSWFADVLGDPKLTIGIQNNYLNVYADGQSLFLAKKGKTSGSVNVSTHPKYLVDPDLSKQVFLEGTKFDVSATIPLITDYKAGTLSRMKRAARVYRGAEKRGVQRVVNANPCVVDLEIAFSRKAEQEVESEEQNPKATLRRIDMACFEKINRNIHLRFWEAKDYVNADLWTGGDTKPPVIRQVKEYERLIETHKANILTSYKRVAGNLVSIAEMARRSHLLCPLIKAVSKGAALNVEPSVGIVVFGFNRADKYGERHKSLLKKLRDAGLVVAATGKAADITLKSATAAKLQDKD